MLSDFEFFGLAIVVAMLCYCGAIAYTYRQSVGAHLRQQQKKLASQYEDEWQSRIDHLTSENADFRRLLTQANQDLIRKSETIEQIMPFKSRADYMAHAISEMEAIWLNLDSREKQCSDLLEKYPWVLWPDFVVEQLIVERGLTNTARLLLKEDFIDYDSSKARFQVKENQRVDLCGWAKINGSIQPNMANQSDNVLLLIELKRPGVTVDRAAIEQAYVYAFSLLELGKNKLMGRPIECLAVGGNIAEDANDVHLRFGATPDAAIRVTPLTYQHLFERAKSTAEHLLGQAHFDADIDKPSEDEAFPVQNEMPLAANDL